ncbi:hypothetical protein GGI03_003824, partial [Coemansia sp. RSA 2337]
TNVNDVKDNLPLGHVSAGVDAQGKAIATISDIEVIGVDPGGMNNIYYTSIFANAQWQRSIVCKEYHCINDIARRVALE